LASPAPRGWRSLPRSFAWVAAILVAAVVGLAALVVVHVREKPPIVRPVQFQIPVPSNAKMGEAELFEISPDGRTLAFMASGSDGVNRLWVRDLNAADARALPGSDNVSAQNTFFWSFDSRFLLFVSSGKVKTISLAGGPAKTLCDVPGGLIGGFSTP